MDTLTNTDLMILVRSMEKARFDLRDTDRNGKDSITALDTYNEAYFAFEVALMRFHRETYSTARVYLLGDDHYLVTGNSIESVGYTQVVFGRMPYETVGRRTEN